ncbi:MAG: Hsp20/alpha crystallin family protein [Verrucomicrobiales bacterium]|nr:Hsp20/alpha crystallin family protein [Verrucomicrobiales bacterium]
MRYNHSSDSMNDWESFFADPFRAFEPLFRPSLSSSFRPSLNRQVEWYEDGANYYALVEMPGVKRENLNVDVENELLRLCYSFTDEQPVDDGAEEKRFEFVLRTPEGVVVEETRAKLEDGILQLTLPKAEEKKPLRIEIN